MTLSPSSVVRQEPVENPEFAPRRFDVTRTAPAEMTMTERVALYGLVVGLRPLRVLEIGCRRGGSAKIIAAALDDLGAGQLISVDPAPAVSAGEWRAIEHRARLLRQASPAALPEAARLIGGSFDFVFIDGDHSTAGVVADVAGVMPFLEPDAALLFHDAHFDQVRAGICEALQRHPLRDCGFIARERRPDDNGGGFFWGGLYLVRLT